MSISSDRAPNRTGTSSVGVETRREALGRFLRERREALAPEQVGIYSHRGRRTPGLRREEVAFLADIGVKWYARLEAGDDIQPSAATLAGVAVALKLSHAELEYMLDLAGLRAPLVSIAETSSATIPVPVQALVRNLRGAAISVSDRILTPLMWGALADAIYGHSRFPDPVERNFLVRGLRDPDFIEFLGPDYDVMMSRAVGMFRLNYSSASPSPHAPAVLEKIKDNPFFQRAWERRVVSDELSRKEMMIRNHAVVGRLDVYAVDLNVAMRPDLYTRTLVPANEETAAKFRRLEEQPALRESTWEVDLSAW